MDLKLTRTKRCQDGIFGHLTGEALSLFTLEHAYPTGSKKCPDCGREMDVTGPDRAHWHCIFCATTWSSSSGWAAKIPAGKYTCKRGVHQLEGSHHSFETFEIMGVQGHSGLLFHAGNFDRDSAGCVLLGETTSPSMILNSARALHAFILAQDQLDSFQLVIEDCDDYAT